MKGKSKGKLKVIKNEKGSPERKLPDGKAWEKWFDPGELAREWEERQRAIKAEREKKKVTIHTKEYDLELARTLTEKEVKEIAEEAAEVELEIRRADVELVDLADRKKSITARANEATKQLSELLEQIRTGTVDESVRVRQITDYGTGLVTEVRMDTGEEISCRGLRPDERQVPLKMT